MTIPKNFQVFTGGGEPFAAGGRARARSRSSYSLAGEPPACVSCEVRPAAVLVPFAPDPDLRYPAQVFPVCGKCALLETV